MLLIPAAAAAWTSELTGLLVHQLPPGEEVTVDLPPPSGFISAPIVQRPFFVCAQSVELSGLVPGALVELEITRGGSTTLQQITANDTRASFQFPPLVSTNDLLRARQSKGGATSSWDAGSIGSLAKAQDVDQTYPTGLPVPAKYWRPFYKCGLRSGVANFVPSSRVWATRHPSSGPEQILFDYALWSFHAAEGGGVALQLGDELRAHYSFCGREVHSPQSGEVYKVVDLPPTSQFPTPVIVEAVEPTGLIVVDGLMNGSWVDVLDAAQIVVASGATASNDTALTATRPLIPGEFLKPRYTFPACGLGSTGNTQTVLSCAQLPAPVVRRPKPGDTEVEVIRSPRGAAILVYSGTTLIGYGSAPVVPLSRALTTTEEILVAQVLGTCRNARAYRINVDCGPKARGEYELLNLLVDRRRRRGDPNATLSASAPAAGQCAEF